MNEIIGTIVGINSFLGKEKVNVEVKYTADQSATAFTLAENRKYVIPAFQREIRWTEENLNVLVQDVSRANKFLGNVILAQQTNDEYLIIDGQQRVSVLLMMIEYLKERWGREIQALTQYSACSLSIDSFKGFDKFREVNYNIDKLDKVDLETDNYYQAERYAALWRAMSEIKEFSTSKSVRSFFTNFLRCTVNVILADKDSTNYNVDYFIDVNLKGVRLDTEDIFKGYLFQMNNSQETQKAWVDVKRAAMCYNSAVKHIIKSKKDVYPLIKILYHYYLCDLFLDEKYKSIEFGSDFWLKRSAKVGENEEYYNKGDHLLRAVGNDSYVIESLHTITKLLDVLILIVTEHEKSSKFFKLFIREGAGKVDTTDITIFVGLMKFLLLNPDVTLPYALVVKYFLEIVKEGRKIDKKYYQDFLSIYAFSILFSFFARHKEINEVDEVLKSTDWYAKLAEKLKIYVEEEKIKEQKVVMQCQYILDDDNEINKHKCKSLAILYNFFNIREGRAAIKKGMGEKIKEFILNVDKFSIEHFIFNESGTYLGNEEAAVPYPKEVKKYKNSVFNYIFIPQALNGNVLKNYYINKKLCILSDKLDEISCAYSKMVINCAKNKFSELQFCESGIIDEDAMNYYYKYNFKGEYVEYAMNIVDHLTSKLTAIGD